MILRYARLTQHPAVFRSLTGLIVPQFDALCADALPAYADAERLRHTRPDRQRAIGGGSQFTLAVRDHLLLTVVWLRVYPTYPVLGYLFGVSEFVAQRALKRVLPILEAAGLDTMRLPDPGRGHRRTLDALLRETPDLALLIDTFEQPVQRHREREEADRYYSGKKKMHTVKTQVVVDERDERIVDVAASEPGPMADITVLRRSGVLHRVPEGIGVLGDLAYVGMTEGYPDVAGAWPRRKPRGKPRSAADVAYNTAFARRRVPVEHVIGRLRHFQAVTQRDRQHRWGITARNRAVAGLVNRTNWRLRG
jgi:DDE superfamily endonuclease/Helix-turn-helix of DDE superfamily endonuclease